MCEREREREEGADSDGDEDADEEVELIKVQQARVVDVQHVKHCVDLVLAEVCHHLHEHQELDVWPESEVGGARGEMWEYRREPSLL